MHKCMWMLTQLLPRELNRILDMWSAVCHFMIKKHREPYIFMHFCFIFFPYRKDCIYRTDVKHLQKKEGGGGSRITVNHRLVFAQYHVEYYWRVEACVSTCVLWIIWQSSWRLLEVIHLIGLFLFYPNASRVILCCHVLDPFPICGFGFDKLPSACPYCYYLWKL